MQDEIYIKRCLEVAKMGIPGAFPNPLVGCVIVHNGKIIGEGYHQEYGGPHAEVNAIKAVKNKELLNEATVYVSLEPCAHHGKTPPCADLLVSHKVKRVVICNEDPFEMVDGEGVSKLKKAGIEVEKGILSSEGKDLNRRFFTWVEKKRPFISLKWAQSKDGFIAPKKQKDGEIFWITNSFSQTLAHKLRAENQGILIGRKTAEKDDPSLDTRRVEGPSPIRMVLDSDLKLNHKLKLMSDSKPTVVFNRIKTEKLGNKEWVKYDGNALYAINDYCLKNNIQNLMVEGGASLIQSYIDEGIWDEIHLFEGDVNIEDGIKGPSFLRLKALKSLNLQADTYTIYRND